MKIPTLWRIEGDVRDGEAFVRDAGVRLEDDGQRLAGARHLRRGLYSTKSGKKIKLSI